MKIDDVLLLAKAGFTSEQIAKMYGDKINADETATVPAVNNGSPEKDPAAATQDPVPSAPQVQAVTPTSAPGSETEGALLKEIKELRLAIQAGAIRQGTGNGPAQQTVEEVLASIIEP